MNVPEDIHTKQGRDLEWGNIDMKKCSTGFSGGGRHANPFMVTAEDEEGFTGGTGRARNKVPPMYFYARALEGAAGCIRACTIHLEQQGKMKNVFKERFRRKKPWKL